MAQVLDKRKVLALVRRDGFGPHNDNNNINKEPNTVENETVILERKKYTIKQRGSRDNAGTKFPQLDCKGVSKSAHLEINAKRFGR